MIVGGYTLDLYCDVPKCENAVARRGNAPISLTGETGGECRRKARRMGWILNMREGTVACPAHLGRVRPGPVRS